MEKSFSPSSSLTKAKKEKAKGFRKQMTKTIICPKTTIINNFNVKKREKKKERKTFYYRHQIVANHFCKDNIKSVFFTYD